MDHSRWQEADKGWLMIRLGVSGWRFLLVLVLLVACQPAICFIICVLYILLKYDDDDVLVRRWTGKLSTDHTHSWNHWQPLH